MQPAIFTARLHQAAFMAMARSSNCLPARRGVDERVLHSFGHGTDGNGPSAGVIFDAVGNLYGTTFDGGVHGEGTVFELSPQSDGSWSEKVIHSFGSGTDGVAPEMDSVLTLTTCSAPPRRRRYSQLWHSLRAVAQSKGAGGPRESCTALTSTPTEATSMPRWSWMPTAISTERLPEVVPVSVERSSSSPAG